MQDGEEQVQKYFLKIRVEYSSDHKFLKKVLEEKAKFLNQDIS